MSSTLRTARLVEGLREQTGGFIRAVAGKPQDTRVPTCPEWPLRTLVGHVGQEHRWAAELVRKGEQLPVPDPWDADPGAPEDWARWLREGADDVIHAIEEVGADTEVPTFLGPRPAVSWLRRMLSDTCVHHYDAAHATDTAFQVADDLAADVISEHLELLAAQGWETLRPAAAELRGHGERIGFRLPSGSGWVATRTPEGVRWEHGPVHADAVVTGPAPDLLLVAYRRVPPEADGLTVTGTRPLLDHWLAHAAL